MYGKLLDASNSLDIAVSEDIHEFSFRAEIGDKCCGHGLGSAKQREQEVFMFLLTGARLLSRVRKTSPRDETQILTCPSE